MRQTCAGNFFCLVGSALPDAAIRAGFDDFAQQFGIMMVPTTIAFKNGKKIKRASGLRLEHVLLSMVQ